MIVNISMFLVKRGIECLAVLRCNSSSAMHEIRVE